MFQQKHPDFIVDTIQDMQKISTDLSFDERKGLISLGGSISKHYAIFAALLSGGFDYAVYLTTSHHTSGSLSGATTQEAKSWGKIKDDAEAATVIGDVTITFPLLMCSVLDELNKENLLTSNQEEETSKNHSHITKPSKARQDDTSHLIDKRARSEPNLQEV